MTQEIQSYRGPSAGGELGPAAGQAYSTEAASTGSVVIALRRRWLMVLLLWLLPAGVLVPYVWLRMQRTYTATAQVQVAPARDPILYPDQDSRVMPFFDAYLNTQAHRISSHQVLTDALADPAVRGLALVERQDPVAALRAALSVENLSRSHLLEISVTQTEPEAAVRLTKAVVDAYMVRVVRAEEAEQSKRLEVLEAKRSQLGNQLRQKRAEIQELAKEYATATDSMFNLLREGIVQSTLETRREQERAELEIIQLREKLRQMEEGVAASALSQEDAAYREQAIEKDPLVRSLREELLAVSGRLVQLQSALTEEHAEVIAARDKKERLQEQLKKERIRAAGDADKETAARRERSLEGTKAGFKQQIEAAQRHRQVLAEKIKGEEAKGMAIGLRGLEIQKLQEDCDKIKQEYDQVNEGIKREEIERYRPARVTIASGAELRPDGIRDKRKKWTVLVLVGALFAAASAALFKDRLDSHLHAPTEVEAGMGLPVLGVVPCLRELKSGRVTREDFIESYRSVRATLSAIGAGGVAPKSILVTSAQPGEGKTSLAVSLAASLAEPGSRVLLIDGDIQAPQIGRLLKLTAPGALETVLTGQRSLSESIARSNLTGVDVLISGLNGQAAGRTFNNRSAARIIREAAEIYDHIVVDSSPALSAASTLVWAHIVDGVIISSLASQSDTTAMRLACQRLRTVGARLLGSVIGNVSRNESLYSYSVSRDGCEDAGRPTVRKPRKVRGLPVVQLPDDGNSSQSAGY